MSFSKTSAAKTYLTESKKMTINGLELKNGLMLAPMAGVTDSAFRRLCAHFGAEYTISEMVSAKAVCYGDKKTALLARPAESERVAIQIFGSEPYYMAKAAELLMKYDPVAIDINMGCPVPKCVKSGEGSALMKDPRLCGRIVAEVKEAVGIPVSVKMRTGFDESSKNALEVALRVAEAGAEYVCIHGRTRAQMYSGCAERDTLKAVKSALSIPVIGNGDIRCGADALSMIAETACDGVAVGRGAMGKPWLFAELKAALNGSPYTPPTDEEKYAAVTEHIRNAVKAKGETLAVLELRKHLAWYSKGMYGSAELRARINTVGTEAEALAVAEEMFSRSAK